MSGFLLFAAWIVMIDYRIEKPGTAEERTTQEMMCYFVCGLWVGEKNNQRFWTQKIPEDIALGLLSAVAIHMGIPESFAPWQLEYEWQ